MKTTFASTQPTVKTISRGALVKIIRNSAPKAMRSIAAARKAYLSGGEGKAGAEAEPIEDQSLNMMMSAAEIVLKRVIMNRAL